jgi:hypothetical protein
MARRLLLAAATLIAAAALAAPAAADALTCAATTCDAAAGYFKLPYNPFEGLGAATTCTPCTAQAGGCAVTNGSCTECCYSRTCTNFDGRGNGYCPYAYVSKVSTTVAAADVDASANNPFTMCCEATTPNAFPHAKDTIVGAGGAPLGVQSVTGTGGDTNWGFDEDTALLPIASNKMKFTGMCFKARGRAAGRKQAGGRGRSAWRPVAPS